jgi:hypothetical protein
MVVVSSSDFFSDSSVGEDNTINDSGEVDRLEIKVKENEKNF